MNKDAIRLEKIKADRLELLRKVRESISNNNKILNEEVESINEIIKQDDKCIKKIEAINDAQILITSLIEKALLCNTNEEVEELREIINKLINKVKREVSRRNLSEEKLEQYKSKVSYLRKDISKYIRFLKREDNIIAIEFYLDNYENLTASEMKELKSLLRKEVNYNTRNSKEKEIVKKIKETKSEVIEPVVENKEGFEFNDTVVDTNDRKEIKEEISIEELLDNEKPHKVKEDYYDKEELDRLFEKELFFKERREYTDLESILEGNNKRIDLYDDYYTEMNDFLTGRANSFDRQYAILDIHEYDKSSLKNIGRFFKNIPIYRINRSRIKFMKEDMDDFYRGNDLVSYIAYIKKRNSIFTGLKCLFSKSYLFSKEGRYLNYHNKCSKWLYNFCQKNNLEFPLLEKKYI